VSVVKPVDHAFNFSFVHLPSCKLIGLAIAKLDIKFHRKGQRLVNTLHGQPPMTLAIVLLKGIPKKSFA
jgi:hypothetical protein